MPEEKASLGVKEIRKRKRNRKESARPFNRKETVFTEVARGPSWGGMPGSVSKRKNSAGTNGRRKPRKTQSPLGASYNYEG